MQSTDGPPLSKLAQHIAKMYPEGISNVEAQDAANRLVRFFEILIAVDQRLQNESPQKEDI